jgi:glycolate oxidase FAD binding subunit
MDSALATVIDRVQAAGAARQSLRIRGAGTKDFYGQALAGDVLDTTALRGIVSYEPSELVVTARCGTPLAELEAVLAERGQALAFEPPHFGPGATVGGMVGAGLSGPSRAAVGSVRDFVLGVHLVNGRGEVLQFGGQVMKNVAGYDVSRLMCGALGTLGLLSEVSLKVLPRPAERATLRFDCDQATALRQLNRWAGQPLPIQASCWVEDAGRPLLYLRLGGARAAVDAAIRTLGGVLEDEARVARDWDALREHALPFFVLAADQCLWRLSVPDTAPVLSLPADAGGELLEWGGALRWVKAPAAALPALRAVAAAVGGTVTLFRHAASCAQRVPEVFHPLAEPLARIHRQLKQQFDPYGVFNPGRLYADF